MAKKNKRTRKEKSYISQASGVPRKTAIRKMRAAPKAKGKVRTEAAKAAPKPESQQKSAGVNRSEGIRLFKVAGRPTKEQFILVYGEPGPRMTWDERAKAGVSAKQFQAALASAARGQK